MTNAEKIRSADNATLAAILTQIEMGSRVKPAVLATEFSMRANIEDVLCAFMEWLESEAKE